MVEEKVTQLSRQHHIAFCEDFDISLDLFAILLFTKPEECYDLLSVTCGSSTHISGSIVIGLLK